MKIFAITSQNKNIPFQGAANNNFEVARLIDQKRLLDSFITMVKQDTTSDSYACSKHHPSTSGQAIFAKYLANILKDIGVQNIETDKSGILTGTLPANTTNTDVKIGILAHMDTKSPGKNINPVIHKKYSGGDIDLTDYVTISSRSLEKSQGKTLITSDGTTVLGADDKAGIAEILETLKVYKENPQLLHPEIKIAFTTDEECHLSGIRNFDIDKFDIDGAYTIDGNHPEIIDKENLRYPSIFGMDPDLFNNYYVNAMQKRYSYRNAEFLAQRRRLENLFEKLLEFAKLGLKKSQLEPKIVSSRGNTDGTYLAYKSIPSANLGTGGQLRHSCSEFITLEDMKKCTENIINTLSMWANPDIN